VAIPFATALLSEYLLAGNARSAALVYSAVMLAMSFGFAVLYSYVAAPGAPARVRAIRVGRELADRTVGLGAAWAAVTSVLIVDDQELIRTGLGLVHRARGIEIRGYASNGVRPLN
jgi:hypothetical protein